MFWLKDTEDPISGVSCLKYILIFSQNQVILSSFQEKIMDDGEYQKLSPEK